MRAGGILEAKDWGSQAQKKSRESPETKEKKKEKKKKGEGSVLPGGKVGKKKNEQKEGGRKGPHGRIESGGGKTNCKPKDVAVVKGLGA